MNVLTEILTTTVLLLVCYTLQILIAVGVLLFIVFWVLGTSFWWMAVYGLFSIVAYLLARRTSIYKLLNGPYIS